MEYLPSGTFDAPLLPPDEQAKLAEHYKAHWYAVWSDAATLPPKEALLAPLQELQGAPGYGPNLRPITPAFIKEMTQSVDAESYPHAPGVADGRPLFAQVARNTAMRQLPTRLPRFEDIHKAGSEYPFDTFQESMLHVGTPLRVWHLSDPDRWLYVSSPCGNGWVSYDDVVRVSEQRAAELQKLPLGVIDRDDTRLQREQHVFRLHLGAVLPVEQQPDGRLLVHVPVPDSAGAVTINGNHFVQPMGAQLTARKVAMLANQMLGQPYGWGGMYELRDCSATTRDLMAPFGIWLPRNSGGQAAAYRRVSLAGLTGEEKEKRVLAEGKPFRTLLRFPGHIALYIGQRDGRAIMLHNFWGVRTKTDGVEGRFVVGKCAITTLQPGLELPKRDPKKEFREILDSMIFLGEP